MKNVSDNLMDQHYFRCGSDVTSMITAYMKGKKFRKRDKSRAIRELITIGFAHSDNEEPTQTTS